MGKKTITINGFKVVYSEEDAEKMKTLFGKSLEEEARKIVKEKKKKNVDRQ